MTPYQEAAMRQALEALKGYRREMNDPTPCDAEQALETALAEPDLFHCPKCGGPADNGHDRSIPPSPYWCTKCMAEPVQEPVAWSFEARHIDTAFGPAVSIRHPGREHKYMRNVKPLYLAPPQRKPLTEEEIIDLWAGVSDPESPDISMIDFARAIERAHGITP